jgi:hypothetical protein
LRVTNPVAAIADAIRATIPALACNAVALIDSPRFPRDLDGASGSQIRPAPRGRAIDAALRMLVVTLNAADRAPALRLAMFPTPPLEYFESCAADPACKPHLRAIAAAILGRAGPANRRRRSRLTAGRLFTRFMLAGFATYPALEVLGARAFESYPYLAFTLWRSAGETLAPKGQRGPALAARRRILARLAGAIGIAAMPEPQTLDQSDAAALAITAALGARRGALLAAGAPAEGHFIVALDRNDARAAAASLHAADASHESA